MHTSWLLPTALLSTSVTAFYPYQHSRKSSEDNREAKRFYPIPTTSDVLEEAGAITLDLKKSKTPVKRANNFPVVTASKPDMINAMAINEDGQDLSYFTTMQFGSKAQNMYMLVDTGSANSWVMSDHCTTSACQAHNIFGPSDSSTLSVTNNAWSLTYGTGSVSGVVASDTVAFANYSIQLGFGLATNASDDFDSYPMDGILGLGLSASDQLGTPTIMSVLASQKLLAQNIAGIHLQRNSDGAKDGQITFGGVDSSKFTSSLGYTNTVSGTNSWEIPVADTTVNGVSCNFTGKTAMIDSGTSYILMPPSDAQTFHSLISGSTASGELFNIPCNSAQVVQFVFSGVAYGVSPKDYVGKPISGSSTVCSSNVIGHQAFGANQWILGDVFLKNVYTVFDYDKNRIGFGTMNGKAASPSSSGASAAATSSSKSSQSTYSSPFASGMAGSTSLQTPISSHIITTSSVSRDLPLGVGTSSTVSPATARISGTTTGTGNSAAAATAISHASPSSTTMYTSRPLVSFGLMLLAILLRVY